MNDHHVLITQLCDELDHNRRCLLDDRRVTHPLADRARAALAADGPAVPEGREPASVTGEPSDGEGPSAEEVEELCEEHCFNVEGYESIECLQGLINDALARWGRPAAPLKPVAYIHRQGKHWEVSERLLQDDERARGWTEEPLYAAPPAPLEGEDDWRGSPPAEWTPERLGDSLTAWVSADETFVDETGTTHLRDLSGNRRHMRPATPPAPAEGEVGELVAWLRNMANADLGGIDELNADRAADLLEQRHPTPVPVNERLPGPEDCDAEGMCWAWRSFDPEEDDFGDFWMTIPCEWLEGSERWTHWLSYPSLPLPDQK